MTKAHSETRDELHDVMTVDEVAAYLRVHYETVLRWCRKGTLPAIKVGHSYRIRRTDLDHLWGQRTGHPAGARRVQNDTGEDDAR